jgi:hypothetical protein
MEINEEEYIKNEWNSFIIGKDFRSWFRKFNK